MNIFIELHKYKPNDYITPEENYFTESFKVILSKFPKLANQIVGKLLGKKNLSSTSLEYLSQNPHRSGSCIIDLEVRDKKGTLLLIEIKLGAKEGKNQLSKYCKLKKGKVVYITKYDEEYNDKLQISHFYWSQIYDIICDYITNYEKKKRNSESVELLKEFKEFMGAKDMSGFRGLSKGIEDYSIWVSFMNEVYTRHRELTKRVREYLEVKGYFCDNIKKDYFDSEYPQHTFYFYPKGKKKSYKKDGIAPFFSLYLNNKDIASGDNDFKNPEGIFLSIGVNSHKLNNANTNELTTDGLIRTDKIKNQWLAIAKINDIIINNDSIKEQLSKVYRFCDKAILLLNKELKKQNIKITI